MDWRYNMRQSYKLRRFVSDQRGVSAILIAIMLVLYLVFA